MRSSADTQNEADFRNRAEVTVVPIFTQEGLPKMEHVGSGVLVKTRTTRGLVTAAHVLAAHPDQPLFVAGRPVVNLHGPTVSTSPLKPEITARDETDLAYIDITMEQAAAIEAGNSTFLDLELDNVEMRSADLGQATCVAIGYHSAAIQLQAGATTPHWAPLVLTSDLIKEARMSRSGFDAARHLGVRFEGRLLDTADKKLTRPNVKGMSGGGVWIHRDGRYRLGGIVIEFYPSKSLLVATRMIELAKLFGRLLHTRSPK